MVYEWIYKEQSILKETIYGIEVLNEPWGNLFIYSNLCVITFFLIE